LKLISARDKTLFAALARTAGFIEKRADGEERMTILGTILYLNYSKSRRPPNFVSVYWIYEDYQYFKAHAAHLRAVSGL
jgi:hypothetical protein